MRLICIPSAGGRAAMFRSWDRALFGRVEVVPIELPGHGGRAAEPLCRDSESVVADILATAGDAFDGPFALFGHSFGAWIAFELARRVVTRRAVTPCALYVSGRRAPHDCGRGPAARFGSGARAPSSGPLHADLEILCRYRFVPGAPLACPIVAFTGSADPACRPAELDEWRLHTAGGFRACVIPGGHFFIHAQRAGFLALLSADLISRESAP